MKRLELDGQRFGRLVVLRDGPHRITKAHPEGIRQVVCHCDCGEETTVLVSNLRAGHVTSCGCFRRERVSQANHSTRKTHGLRDHPLYATWVGMRQRCNNPKNPSYASYGGRGIKVDPRWNDLATFISDVESEIGVRPPGKSLDRKENDGNYEPGNVQWADAHQQAINQRSVNVLSMRVIALEAELARLRATL